MTNWKAIAEAKGISFSEEQAAVMAARLTDLEQRMAALTATLEPADDPVSVFDPGDAE